MHNPEDLRMWHLAKDISAEIDRLFPPRVCRRVPGFRSQIVEAAESVPANISEGCGRDSDKQLQQYLRQSRGSLFEVNNFLATALERGMLARKTYVQLTRRTDVLRRMIDSFRDRLNDKDPTRSN